MTSVQAGSTLILFSFLTIIFFTSGCVVDNHQQPGNTQYTTSIPVLVTSNQGIETTLSIDQVSEIIQTFSLPQKIDNLTYIKTFTKANTTLYEFQSDNASFTVNPTTGRVQSVKWTKSGPFISGITSDINQSCKLVGEYAKEKYPAIWVSNDERDMDVQSAKKWPLSIDTKYECAWFETLYYPDKKASPHYTIWDRNSVDIVIDPSTGIIQSYEETYTPLNPSLNLKPSISEEQAGELAKFFFERDEIVSNLPSEQTSYGLHVSSNESGRQNLLWAFEIVQHRNATFGGLIGIDAHDGHVVYFASF